MIERPGGSKTVAEVLLREGIAAARAGQRDLAHDLLVRAVGKGRKNIQAWLWLSSVVDTPTAQERCLEHVLGIDPEHVAARRGLEAIRSERADHAAEARPNQERGLLAAATQVLAPRRRVAAAHAQTVVSAPVDRALPSQAGRDRIVRHEFAYIALLGLALLAFITLDVRGLPGALPILRLMLGVAFVLFAPGYALQAALFPRAQDLDGPERLGLSFGLSVSLVPVIVLILDRLPWGISQWAIVASEGITYLLLWALAVWRKRRLPEEERYQVAINLDWRGWWQAQDRTSWILYGVLILALYGVAVGASVILFAPTPGERLTEFYALGSGGLAEGYPVEAIVGEPVTLTLGIANREGESATYRIEVRAAGVPVSWLGPIALDDEAVWEQDVSFSLSHAGEEQRIEFLLYRDAGEQPYRSLLLFMDGMEREQP
jgi:uncharacterized membrane protein